VVSSLARAQIDGKKTEQDDGKWAIAVNQLDAFKAISILNDNRLIATVSESDASVTTTSGLLPTREEERLVRQKRTSRDLERTLRSLPGVLDARVHLNLPQRDPYLTRDNPEHSSGSVLLVIDKSFDVTDQSVIGLVAGASGVDGPRISITRSLNTGSQDPRTDQRTAMPTTSDQKDRWAASPELLIWTVIPILVGSIFYTCTMRKKQAQPFVLNQLPSETL